jgi:hypothetical protein
MRSNNIELIVADVKESQDVDYSDSHEVDSVWRPVDI